MIQCRTGSLFVYGGSLLYLLPQRQAMVGSQKNIESSRILGVSSCNYPINCSKCSAIDYRNISTLFYMFYLDDKSPSPILTSLPQTRRLFRL